MTPRTRSNIAAVALATLVAGAIFIVEASRAKAQTLCATEGQFLQSLAENHGELPVFRGTTGVGPVMIVTMSPGGAFTTLIVIEDGSPNPKACLVNEGEDGVTFNVKVAPKGKQS